MICAESSVEYAMPAPVSVLLDYNTSMPSGIYLIVHLCLSCKSSSPAIIRRIGTLRVCIEDSRRT